MLPMLPEAPTVQEWLVAIQNDPDLAQQYFDQLIDRIQAAGGGAMAATYLLMSFRGYHSAQTLVAAAATDPVARIQLTRETHMGTIMLAPYPSPVDWQHLIQNDPASAGEISTALRLKRAHYGIAVPSALETSLRSYGDLTHIDTMPSGTS